jgi:hypothetical protein
MIIFAAILLPGKQCRTNKTGLLQAQLQQHTFHGRGCPVFGDGELLLIWNFMASLPGSVALLQSMGRCLIFDFSVASVVSYVNHASAKRKAFYKFLVGI